jgi:hypothetical protein
MFMNFPFPAITDLEASTLYFIADGAAMGGRRASKQSAVLLKKAPATVDDGNAFGASGGVACFRQSLAA